METPSPALSRSAVAARRDGRGARPPGGPAAGQSLRRARALRAAAYALPAAAVVIPGALLVGAGGHDDSHITYWAARMLAEHGEILNYNADRVEQSSSLMQVLLLAGLAALTGAEMVGLGHALAIAFGVASVVLVQRLGDDIAPGVGLPAALLTATAAPFLYWTFGGLETSMAAFGSLWLVSAAGRWALGRGRPAAAGAALLFYLLTRPESALVAACLLAGGVGLLVMHPAERARLKLERATSPAGRLLLALLATAAITAAVAAARLAYFGSPVPQPVVAKAGAPDAYLVLDGFRYLREHLFGTPPAALVNLVTLAAVFGGLLRTLARREPDPRLVLGATFLVAHGSFVVLAGGDWMALGRFVAPAVPLAFLYPAYLSAEYLPRTAARALLAVLVALNVAALPRALASGSAGNPGLAGLRPGTLEVRRAPAAGEPASTPPVAVDDGGYSPFERMNRIHVRDIPTIAALDGVVSALAGSPAFADRPVVVMSGQMGMVLYHVVGRHYERVHVIDRYGLTERSLTTCWGGDVPRRDFGLLLDYQAYFARQRSPDACAGPLPDVVFDLSYHRGAVLGSRLFRVVYEQSGTLHAGPPSRSIGAGQFIAVRSELVPLAAGPLLGVGDGPAGGSAGD